MSDRNADNEKLKAALEEIGTVLTPSQAEIIGQTADPLAQGCLLVGHEMGIKFVLPRNLAEISDPEKKLEAICRESQIQKKKLQLPDQWWEKDHGPLLGFWGEAAKPVALLNRTPYQLVDKQNTQKITKKTAAAISSAAYMFYVPFDSRLKSGKQILHRILTIHMKSGKAELFTLFSATLYALFPPFAVKLFFQYAVPENNPLLILYLALGLLFSAVGLALSHYLQGILFVQTKTRSSNLILGAFWDRILRLPSHFFRRYSTGDLSSRMLALGEIAQRADIHSLNLVFSGSFALVYLAAMLYFAPPLAFLVLILSLFGLGLSSLCAYFKIAILKKALEAQSAIHGALLKFVVGIGKLRTARADTTAFSYWASLFAKYQSHRRKAQNLQDIATTANHFLPLLSFFFIYLALLAWIPVKQISLSDFLAFSIAFGSFSLSLYPLGNTLLQLANILPLWDRAKIFLEENPEEQARQPAPANLSGHIHLENITYSFDPKIPPILNGLSLTIKPGEFIGITGKGKTTLLRLLVGLEKPQSGVIFYDDRDLWSMELQDLRKQIGVYFQELGMFSGSVMVDLCVGGQYSKEQVVEALSFSNFAQDVQSFPMKGATGTSTLSGSQKERLFLAKAVINNPPILLLDEPTVSLDSESRNLVNNNIANRKGTRLYATNRLDNLRKADRIYVLDKGQIAQTGTFAELSSKPGLFAELLAKQ